MGPRQERCDDIHRWAWFRVRASGAGDRGRAYQRWLPGGPPGASAARMGRGSRRVDDAKAEGDPKSSHQPHNVRPVARRNLAGLPYSGAAASDHGRPRALAAAVQRGRDLLAGDLLIGLDAEQAYAPRCDDLLLLVEDARFPNLRAPSACDRRRDRVQLGARTHRAHEARAVLQPDHRLTARQGKQRRADRGQGFDQPGVETACSLAPARTARTKLVLFSSPTTD